MKTLFKLISIVMLLFTTMTFAQMGEGCIEVPKPFKDLIKSPIPKSSVPEELQAQLHSARMVSYLSAFNDEFNAYQRQEVPQEFVTKVDEISEEYRALTDILVEKSADFESLKQNIVERLATAETLETAESLILFHYKLQMVENSDVYRDGNNSLDWKCIALTLGYSATQVMSNPDVSVYDPGVSGGGIAGGGCTPTFNPFPPRFCR